MSGLCGLVRLDGAPASREQLEPVWSALVRRGPDGAGIWAEGRIALGFRLLATTPEAAAERLPLHHAESGCTIIADVRLDNREELAAALGLDPRGRGDGELILQAYLRWGDEAPLYLLGDYAFAIWDSRRRRLLAARDPMGMRQFHYSFRPGRLFAFATDDWALAAHEEVDSSLNELRVIDLMQDMEAVDLTSTFYTGILRLPAAHRLILADDRLTVERFWSLEPQSIPRRFDRGALAEELRDLLDQSVRARLRSTGKVGAMLSGGLDSSSVVALGARALGHPLPTFSAVTRTEGCIETQMISRMQAIENLQPRDLVAEEWGKEAAEVQRLACKSNPFGGSAPMLGCLYREAQKAGCNVVLDGVTSDVLFSASAVKIELLRQGRWGQAWREAKLEREFFGAGPRPIPLFLRQVRAAVLPGPLRTAYLQLRFGRDMALASSKVINRDAFRRLRVAERRRAYRQALPTPSLSFPNYRAALIVSHELLIAREHYDRLASLFSIEARDPFADLRLVSFARSLPPEALVHEGWHKHCLRAAMQNLLPEEVQWRRGRHHVGFQFGQRALASGAGNWLPIVERQRTTLESWLQPAIIDHVRTGDPSSLDLLARPSIYLALHLDHRGVKAQARGQFWSDEFGRQS